jgi:hypothetical protein
MVHYHLSEIEKTKKGHGYCVFFRNTHVLYFFLIQKSSGCCMPTISQPWALVKKKAALATENGENRLYFAAV